MIRPSTTLAELEAVLRAFGAHLEAGIAENGEAYYARVFDSDFMECAIGASIAEAIDSALVHFQTARLHAEKATIQ